MVFQIKGTARESQLMEFAHNRLLYKLESYGITGNTLRWIKAFLENQRQCVVVVVRGLIL